MKNKLFYFSSFVAACLLVIAACTKTEDPDSVTHQVSIPYIPDGYKFMQDAYVFGVGNTHIYSSLPEVVAVAVDSIYGFEGGYGGKTGSDSIDIHRSEILGWPDTVSVGAGSLLFEKYTRGNYRVQVGTNVVIAGPIPNPGPTAMEGLYKRNGNNYVIELKKVFDGVYVIDNPGGAAVAPFPYLFYNYAGFNGQDSLAFPNQGNECGGGTQLVGSSAPCCLTANDYSNQYPPLITNASPLTVAWKVFTYSSASKTAVQPGAGAALCTWGSTATRTFVKQ